jgi:DNA-binding CsgD family transcriptional regulator
LRLARVGRFAEARAQGAQWLTETSADAGDGDWSASADALYGLGLAYAQQGEPQTAARALGRARAMLEERRHDEPLGAVLMDTERLIALAYHADDPPVRQRLAATAEEAWARGAANLGGSYPPRFACAPSLLVEGEWDEANTLAQVVYHERGYASKEHASAILAPLTCARGDESTLMALIRERLPNGPETEPGTIYYNLALHQAAGTWAIETGDLSGAQAWLDAHDRWLAWSGAVLGQSEGHALWAQYHRAAGDIVAAYASATRALQHATDPRQPLALLTAHRLLGELDTAAGRYDAAEKQLDAALALADACAAPYERALTLLACAQLRAATGDTPAATTLLDAVRAICTPLGAQPALARADALVARLSAAKDAVPAYPVGLSGREVEVLRLVVAGYTNRDIADALFLSEHTVRVHVRNILTKTDTANRTEAAAFALRHGLA